MKAKWCLSAIIFILTLLGVVNQQQSPVPNQEIILQFTDSELNSNEVAFTLSSIKKQLNLLGVKDLKVEKGSLKGQLKLSYYSNISVVQVQNKLSKSKAQNLQLPKQSKHQEKESIAYNIDVYDIQNTSNYSSDLDGKFILESKLKNERSFQTNYSFLTAQVYSKLQDGVVNVAYKVSHTIFIDIEEALHTIPEVRAGPNC